MEERTARDPHHDVSVEAQGYGSRGGRWWTTWMRQASRVEQRPLTVLFLSTPGWDPPPDFAAHAGSTGLRVETGTLALGSWETTWFLVQPRGGDHRGAAAWRAWVATTSNSK